MAAASYSTVENAHARVMEKIQHLTTAAALLADAIGGSAGAIGASAVAPPCNRIPINVIRDEIATIYNDYPLAVVSALLEYYSAGDNAADSYYRIVAAENFIPKLDDIGARLRAYTNVQNTQGVTSAQKINKLITAALAITIYAAPAACEYDICCGARMRAQQETAELICDLCGCTTAYAGSTTADSAPSNKHSGYDTSRHYKFWIERLQARENKTFTEQELANIRYVLARDKILPRALTCAVMRAVLKDPKVSATYLNDHAPLLVKLFGGTPPPHFTHDENRQMSIKFNKIMALYEQVNPSGKNKPYYPYFIYKIVESMFARDPEKLRLLDYVHLQSRDTVIKNDNHYKAICELAAPADGLVYAPTTRL